MKATEFEAIAKWAGQNDKQIIAQVINGLDFIDDVRVIRNVSGHGMLLPKMTVNKGNRPLNLAIEKPNSVNRNFSGRKLFVYPGMKIIKMIPEEFRATFADRALDPKATEIPLAAWVWGREFERISADINDDIYLSDYKGDAEAWAAGSTYDPGDYVNFGEFENIYKNIETTSAGQSPTTHPSKWLLVNGSVISMGWGTIIKNEIDDNKIIPIATGPITDDDALDQLDMMYRTMPAAHRKLGGIFRVSSDVFKSYLDCEKATYPQAANPDFGDGRKFIYGSGKKWEIKEATWMGTSGRVIATQKDNLAFGTFMEGDENKISKVVETLHGYVAIVKWLQGCEICDLETLYVNDQDETESES